MYIEKSIDISWHMVCFSLYDDDWCCQVKFLNYSSVILSLYGHIVAQKLLTFCDIDAQWVEIIIINLHVFGQLQFPLVIFRYVQNGWSV